MSVNQTGVTAQPTDQPPDQQEATPQQIFIFLKNHWKEILSIGSALISSVVGIVVWVNVYFATSKQLSRLDCVMSANILVHSKPTEIDLVRSLLESKKMEAGRLQKRILEHYDEDLSGLVTRLATDTDELQRHLKKAQDDYDAADEKRIACLKSESTPPGGK